MYSKTSIKCAPKYQIDWRNIPINMSLCASTGPVLGRCCQHRNSTGPVLATNGMFTGKDRTEVNKRVEMF